MLLHNISFSVFFFFFVCVICITADIKWQSFGKTWRWKNWLHYTFKFCQKRNCFSQVSLKDCFGLYWSHNLSLLIKRSETPVRLQYGGIPALIPVKAFSGPYFGCVQASLGKTSHCGFVMAELWMEWSFQRRVWLDTLIVTQKRKGSELWQLL